MLILNDVGMRISMQVICLDRGALSQQVRAIDAHSHRMFQARVIGAALLEAQL
jgi:flagella basal body P-ring formation protein FlgA